MNFFFIAAWIISFYLAKKDDSLCLDDTIPGGDSTFRKWLYANGSITVIASFFAILFSLIYTKDIKALIVNRIRRSNKEKR